MYSLFLNFVPIQMSIFTLAMFTGGKSKNLPITNTID